MDAERRSAARRRGGQGRATVHRLRKRVPLVPVLEGLLARVIQGTIAPQQATAAAALVRAMLAAEAQHELTEQLREVEARLDAYERQSAAGGRW